MLKEDYKQKLRNAVEQKEIDVSELASYKWDSNPYCVEPELVGSSGCGVWDEDEEYNAQIEAVVSDIEADGLFEVIELDLNDSDLYLKDIKEEMLKMNGEALEFLESLKV